MSFQTNIGRGVRATVGLVLAAALALPCRAEQAVEPLPDPGDVVAAYGTLRDWLTAFRLPRPDDDASRLPLRDATGVCVILRHSGRVVGVGADWSGGGLMVRRAAARALGEVLADPSVSSLPDSVIQDIGRSLTLELEVGGALVPLVGRTFDMVAAQLEPGLDGVAMRRGDDLALLFPAQMRAANTAGRAERVLGPLAADLGLAPMTLPELLKRFPLSIYRFGATHLTQAAPDTPPFATVRGDTLVDDADVTRQALEDLAASLAARLAGSISPLDDPLGLMGTYRPVADRYDPLIAPPLDQALGAWALARYGAHAQATDASNAAARILDEMRLVVAGEDEPLADAGVCAAVVYAALELEGALGGDGEREQFVAEAVACVSGAFVPKQGFARTGDGLTVPPHTQALIAAAMARLLVTGSQRVGPQEVREAIDATWESVPPHRQVALLPWLGWAESDWAAATGRPNPAAERLRGIREYLDASRVGSADRPGPPDLAGGLVLSSGDRLAATAQTVRPASYLATMIRDPDLTRPDEAAVALGRHLKTMRFVMQLTVRDGSVWAYRNAPAARGGIRAATWDCDQPVGAQALGLITATETLTTLDALSGGRSRAAGPPVGTTNP